MTIAIGTEGTCSIPADWRIDHSGRTPRLIVSLDLGDLLGIADVGEWQFGTVLDVGSESGTELTLQYVPNGADVA